jgi:two-component system, NtrC family, nitrogen regulation response regulator GlnG
MSCPYKILIVDDEENIRNILKLALEKKGWSVTTVADGESALKKLATTSYLMIFSDIFMEGMSGLELLARVREADNPTPMVMITAQDTMNNTIEAMRLGAYDYVSKPFDLEDIYALVEKIITLQKFSPPENKASEKTESPTGPIVGKSKQMQDVFKIIGKAADSDLPTLITGESGTGKELVARALHNYSRRNKKPFIGINCAAIARDLLESELFGHEKGAFTGATETKEGKFEIAEGGSLFLDEIGDMDPALQAKILRVLQDKEYYRVGGKNSLKANVRIIAATHQNLNDLIEEKRFREDLYHRLNVVALHLPPLRERAQDALFLAQHFVETYSRTLTRAKVYLSPESENLIRGYLWPGNVRELENACKSAIILASAGPILPEHFPLPVRSAVEPATGLQEQWEQKLSPLIAEFIAINKSDKDGELYDALIQIVEKHLFQQTLAQNSGKQTLTAQILGINRNTLKRKIDAMKIDSKNSRSSHDSDKANLDQ